MSAAERHESGHPGNGPRRAVAPVIAGKARHPTYDRRHEIEKQRALKAKKINKLKRLKKQLQAEGKLKPTLLEVRWQNNRAEQAAGSL